jgi:UDP-glucuronate 4-epimerase
VSARSVLVTGAAGFIGSHLVDALLADGVSVTGVDNFDSYYEPAQKRRNIRRHLGDARYRLIEADICELDAMLRHAEGPYDAIVHLAARPGVRASLDVPLESERVNVRGTTSVLELGRILKIPQFVFGSSSSVYGVNPSVPWREDDNVLLPISPYAATKVSGEMLAHVYSRLCDMRLVVLRFFTVYGPRQRPDLAMHKFAAKMLAGQSIPLYGDGRSRRDYTFVGDIVEGIRAALAYDRERYTILNLGAGRTVTLVEMVETLERVLGVRARIERLGEQPGDVPQTWADISRAEERLGYRPKTSLEDGLIAFRQWLEEERRN